MPRRTADPCTTLSLSLTRTTHQRIHRLAAAMTPRGALMPAPTVMARDLLLAALAAQEEALGLPALAAPAPLPPRPRTARGPRDAGVFLPGSAAHLRALHPQGAAPPQALAGPMNPSADAAVRAGLVHVAPGLDDHDDFAAFLAQASTPAPQAPTSLRGLFPNPPDTDTP